MKFYSTNNTQHTVSLREAVLHGLAPDRGLYMPVTIPKLPKEFIQNLGSLSFQEIAFQIAESLLKDDLTTHELRRMVEHTISFDAPVVPVDDQIATVELFHGPTLAFKDFGARFLSQMLAHFATQGNREITVLVATSGDTGSAVANGFLGVDATRVVVLYPSGKVSEIQEKQFTTLGKNITAVEVDGTFDDCQRLVKEAFLDAELQRELMLTSANSINIARLIPQVFYYFRAFAQLQAPANSVVFSVPSGNFGNLTAGLLAQRMGLPVRHFLAATNANDIVPSFLQSGHYQPRPSMHTISNAMDVGDPSNFVRMMNLFSGDRQKLASAVTGFAYTDDATRAAMRDVFQRSGYVLDPHGAIGYLALRIYLQQHPGVPGIFLETAHPGKFRDVVEQTLGKKIALPETLLRFLDGTKSTVQIKNEFTELKKVLLG